MCHKHLQGERKLDIELDIFWLDLAKTALMAN